MEKSIFKAPDELSSPDIHWWEVALLIVAYFFAARLGQLVAIPPGNVTPFWPAAGIILYAVIIKGPRIWPGIWLGAIVGNGWAYASFESVESTLRFLLSANLNGAGDTLCAIFGFHMIKRAVRPSGLIFSGAGAARFIIYAALLGSMISATLGVTGLCAGGFLPWSDFSYTWITWTVGDGVGMLVVTPLLLAWHATHHRTHYTKATLWEQAAFLMLVTLIAIFGFGLKFNQAMPNYLVSYIAFPILVWSSFRYGGRIAFTAVAIFTVVAIIETAAGIGIFASPSLNESLIQLQLFIAVATTTTLFLNAVIFERSFAEESLRRANTELETANNELEAFSYSVSHDLRTPVRATTSFSQLLLQEAHDKLDEAEQDYLRRIIRAGKHMAELIDDVITLSLVSHQTLEPKTIDLTVMSHDIINELSHVQPGHKVDVEIQDGMTARGDPRLLRIVMANLISNAWKYTERQTQPSIAIRQEDYGADSVYSVRDNGIGFDEIYKDRLFKVFQRLHSSDEFSGTGIGLATVQRIIHRHGGRAWARGKVGEGASFYFSLGTNY